MFGRRSRWGSSLLFLVILALIAGMGCRKELPELFDRNNPPETYITSAPVESIFDSYKVHVHWHGEDIDEADEGALDREGGEEPWIRKWRNEV